MWLLGCCLLVARQEGAALEKTGAEAGRGNWSIFRFPSFDDMYKTNQKKAKMLGQIQNYQEEMRSKFHYAFNLYL